jgi:hypothetical protein
VAQSDQLTAGLIRKGLARGGDPDAPARRESDSGSAAPDSRPARLPLATRPPPQPTNRRTLGVRIPEDLHERLAAIQYYTRKTIQELVTGMLQDGIDAMEAEIHRQRGGDP